MTGQRQREAIKATRAGMAAELAAARERLEAAEDLLNAIAEMAEAAYGMPDVELARRLGRIQHAAGCVATDRDYGRAAGTLRALLADDREQVAPRYKRAESAAGL